MGRYNLDHATYTYLDAKDQETGPYCVECIEQLYEKGIIRLITPICRHTQARANFVHLLGMMNRQVSPSRFVDFEPEATEFNRNRCVGVECRTKSANAAAVARDEVNCRGRPATRRFSPFYRDNFGDHSPEEYVNLRIYGFAEHLKPNDVKGLLQKAFRTFSAFEIRAVTNEPKREGEPNWWVYVNFEHAGPAKKIRTTKMQHMRKLLGPDLVCDPAGIVRDQGGTFKPDKYTRSLRAAQQKNLNLKQSNNGAMISNSIGVRRSKPKRMGRVRNPERDKMREREMVCVDLSAVLDAELDVYLDGSTSSSSRSSNSSWSTSTTTDADIDGCLFSEDESIDGVDVASVERSISARLHRRVHYASINLAAAQKEMDDAFSTRSVEDGVDIANVERTIHVPTCRRRLFGHCEKKVTFNIGKYTDESEDDESTQVSEEGKEKSEDD